MQDEKDDGGPPRDSMTSKIVGFRISGGGPFHDLLVRLHLASARPGRVEGRILVFVALTWLPMLLFCAFEGTLVSGEISFLGDPSPHVRYLIVLPLMVGAELLVDPLLGTVVGHIASSGVLQPAVQKHFREAVDELMRRRDSRWADVVAAVIAFGMSLASVGGYGDLVEPGGLTDWLSQEVGDDLKPTLAGWWYIVVCSPLLQFLIYRWLWRYVIWVGFLWRLSRMRMRLQPAHPDLAGGISVLGQGQTAFTVVFVGISALLAATLANEILFDGHTLAEFWPLVFAYVIVALAILLAPLLMFLRRLLASKRRGLRQYGTLGYRLAHAFHRKWIRTAAMDQGEELMNAVDSSSMADFIGTFDAVRQMRIIPLTVPGVSAMAVMLFAPFLPLLLTEFSAAELFQRLLDSLV